MGLSSILNAGAAREKTGAGPMSNADREVERKNNLPADKQAATKGGPEADGFWPVFLYPLMERWNAGLPLLRDITLPTPFLRPERRITSVFLTPVA